MNSQSDSLITFSLLKIKMSHAIFVEFFTSLIKGFRKRRRNQSFVPSRKS